MEPKRIKSALISVFYKDGLEDIVRALDAQGVTSLWRASRAIRRFWEAV